jgi:hypothetical protein
VLTMTMHATSMTFIVVGVRRVRIRLGNQGIGPRHALVVLIGTIATVGLMLSILHGLEAALWAKIYIWLGAIHTFDEAMFYSIDTMTTRGASGLGLPPHWQMMGALEAVDGVLLFGMSTAFMFAVMQRGFTEILDAIHRK